MDGPKANVSSQEMLWKDDMNNQKEKEKFESNYMSRYFIVRALKKSQLHSGSIECALWNQQWIAAIQPPVSKINFEDASEKFRTP